jgi:ANTH domain-containing protein
MIRTKGEFGITCPRSSVLSASTDSDCSYETITELMTLQDQIDNFQKLIFSHFQGWTNNECRISALVPLVQESYGIYKFVTSMLRAMHTSTPTSGLPLSGQVLLLTAPSQPLVMMTPWSLCGAASIPSTIDSSGFISSAQIYGISLV